MIVQWWRRDFGRDPAFDELSGTQRVVVEARIARDAARYDRVANGILVGWTVAVLVGVVAFALTAPTLLRGWGPTHWGPVGIFLLIPLYVRGWHDGLTRKMRHRTIMAVVREDRLAAIDAALARGARH